MFIDCHTHTNFSAYKEDSKEVIQRALENNVWMIQVGSQKDTSKRAVEIAKEYPKGVYAAVALHPVHLFEMDYEDEEALFHTRYESFDKNFYTELAQSSQKVIVLGECGLDYYRIPGDFGEIKKTEGEVLRSHFEIAQELKIPIMIHCRGREEDPYGAYKDIVDIAKEFPAVEIMMHCYLCPIKEITKSLLEHGVYFSFSGIITFKKNEALHEVIKYLSSDRILTETDAPYLTPEPYRGKRNEPLYVQYVLKKIAEVKRVSEDALEERVFQNAKNLFKI